MKLWAVIIERTIMVLADDDRKAERVAQDSERDEMMTAEPDFINAIEVKDRIRIPKVWRDCIPYGGIDDRNCEQIFESSESEP